MKRNDKVKYYRCEYCNSYMRLNTDTMGKGLLFKCTNCGRITIKQDIGSIIIGTIDDLNMREG